MLWYRYIWLIDIKAQYFFKISILGNNIMAPFLNIVHHGLLIIHNKINRVTTYMYSLLIAAVCKLNYTC